jgi:heme/copper-type cytochrome/quinol oxidase subunit 4
MKNNNLSEFERYSRIKTYLIGLSISIVLGFAFYYFTFKYYLPAEIIDDDYIMVFAFLNFVVLIIVLFNMAKLGNTLGKNGTAWAWASIVFPMLVFIAIQYFYMIGIYNIIQFQIKKFSSKLKNA